MRNHRTLPPLLVLALMLVLMTALVASHSHNTADDGSNVTIAYTFWNHRLPLCPSSSSDTSKDTTNYTLVLMTCFQDAKHHDSITTTTPGINMALLCCRAMARGASSASSSTFAKSIFRMDTETCQQEGSVVPPFSNFNNNTAAGTNLQFMWYGGAWQEPSIGGLGPEKARRTFVWNDQEKSGFWIPLEKSDKSSDSQFYDHNDWVSSMLPPAQGVGDNYSHKISIDLDASLSQTGGMHRSLHHQLTMPLSHKDMLLFQNKNLDNLQQLQLHATFLLFIPSDMFLDAEDAFDPHQFDVELLQNQNENVILSDQEYNYSLSLESERMIDIEQPAFASPHHAVVIHLEWNATAASIINAMRRHATTTAITPSLAIHFTTKIHLRYPSPISSASASAKTFSMYQPVLMMPPLWMRGTLSLVFDDSDRMTDFFLVPNNGTTIPGLLGALSDSNKGNGEQQHQHAYYQSPNLLTTWVASAVKEDFVWVASFTVMCSIVGAVVLGYETFKISTLSLS